LFQRLYPFFPLPGGSSTASLLGKSLASSWKASYDFSYGNLSRVLMHQNA
jgi:hypothetical protein